MSLFRWMVLVTGSGTVGDGVIRGCSCATPAGSGFKTACVDTHGTRARRMAEKASDIFVDVVDKRNFIQESIRGQWVGIRKFVVG